MDIQLRHLEKASCLKLCYAFVPPMRSNTISKRSAEYPVKLETSNSRTYTKVNCSEKLRECWLPLNTLKS